MPVSLPDLYLPHALIRALLPPVLAVTLFPFRLPTDLQFLEGHNQVSTYHRLTLHFPMLRILCLLLGETRLAFTLEVLDTDRDTQNLKKSREESAPSPSHHRSKGSLMCKVDWGMEALVALFLLPFLEGKHFSSCLLYPVSLNWVDVVLFAICVSQLSSTINSAAYNTSSCSPTEPRLATFLS